MPLPVNFEQLVKLPPADGYPTTIKASDLMRNFAYCDLVAGDGVSIVDIPPTTAQHPQRRISVEAPEPEPFEPDGSDFNLIFIANALTVDPDTFVVSYNPQSGPFVFGVRKGIVYRLLDLPADDRDYDEFDPGTSGAKYPRYTINTLAPHELAMPGT